MSTKASTSPKVINEKYFHIDNGGFKFKVDEHGCLTIGFGFFGYSHTEVMLTEGDGFDVKKLADFLHSSATLLEQHRKTEEA